MSKKRIMTGTYAFFYLQASNEVTASISPQCAAHGSGQYSASKPFSGLFRAKQGQD
jgi:hypothetical protein